MIDKYALYERIGYHPQTYGHEKMIDDLIDTLGEDGTREHLRKLEQMPKDKKGHVVFGKPGCDQG